MKIPPLFLFQDMSEAELKKMESQAGLRKQTFLKNETVFRMGDLVNEMGIVLSGCVMIESVDLWGNRSILNHVEPGQVFAESYALCREPMMVSAVCPEESEILFIHLPSLMNPGGKSETWQTTFLQNLLQVTAQKNLTLSNRIFFTTPKSVRSRLLIYLSSQAVRNGSRAFTIPFNRQQLADYLNLDRSALSKELCRMRDEGQLYFRKNKFILYETENPE